MTKEDLFTSLYPAIKKAMEDSITLYNKSLDPNEKETVKIKTGFGDDVEINLNTKKGKMEVSLEKSSEVFGTAMAANLTPVLVEEFDKYIKNNLTQT